jgi:hypothetical protein
MLHVRTSVTCLCVCHLYIHVNQEERPNISITYGFVLVLSVVYLMIIGASDCKVHVKYPLFLSDCNETWILYIFFWVIPRRLNFICRRFGTLCSIFIGIPTYLLRWKCSETSAYKIQTSGNYPEENIQHTEHGESLKSRKPGFSP